MKSKYNKLYSSPTDIVNTLISRGLQIPNISRAKHYLSHIGYYRLSAYMYPLLQTPKENHLYKHGSSFDKVLMLYRFDKKLRLLIFNEIEKIEVATRTAIVNSACELTNDPFWMVNAHNFVDLSKFQKTLNLIDAELKHSKEEFIVHFKNAYLDKYPPAWMLSEILPFGVITNIYSNLKEKRIKKNISQSFDLQIAPFESWLTIISLTRNACCHHARVWNKQNTMRPMIPNKLTMNWITIQVDELRIYFNLCIIKYFLNIISPNNDFTQKLEELLGRFPEIDISAMGFPKEWKQEPLWQ